MTEFDPRYRDGRPPGPSRWSAGRIIAAVATAIIALPLLLMIYVVISAYVAPKPYDGYSLIFGSFALVVLSFLLLCIGPWALPARLRARAFAIGGLVLAVVIALLFIALGNG